MVAGKRFVLNKKETSDGDKYEKYVDKFQTFVGEKEKEVTSLEALRVESAILREQEYSHELQQLICNTKSSGIDWSRISEDNVINTEENLELSESLAGININSVQTNMILSDGDECIKTWQIIVHPSDIFAECEVLLSFKTIGTIKPQKGLPSIGDVRIKVSGLESGSDLEAAIHFCQEENELQMFNMILTDYLKCYATRNELIKKALKNDNVEHRGDNTVEFKTPEGGIIAHLSFEIKFNLGNKDWTESWLFKFTELGLKAAESCNLPEQLINDGTCKDWSAEYCIETMTKVANMASDDLDESEVEHFKTPVAGAKHHHISTPLNESVSEGSEVTASSQESGVIGSYTPLNSQSQKPRQRRI